VCYIMFILVANKFDLIWFDYASTVNCVGRGVSNVGKRPKGMEVPYISKN